MQYGPGKLKSKRGRKGGRCGGKQWAPDFAIISQHIFICGSDVCNASTQETEAGAFSVQGQPVAPQRGLLFCFSGA